MIEELSPRSARRGLSGIECRPVQRVQRLGGGMPWYLSALVLARSALLPVVCRPSGGAGAGASTSGVYGESWGWGGEPFNHRKNKKGSKKHPHPHFKLSKFPAKTKRPLQRVCVLCYTCLTSLEREESTMAKSKMTTCKHCGAEIAASAKVCPQCGGKNKPPIYKRWWFIAIIVLIVLSAIGGSSDSGKKGFEEGYKDATSNKASASAASSVASVVPEISEDDYKAECQTVDYKELCRYPEKYEGTKIVVKVKVSQIIDANFSGSEKAWRTYTDNSGYGFYADDEYYMLDKRGGDAVKILEDDIITVYGEFTGLEKITRALTSTTDELPRVEVKYADLVDE
nr:MAG TPA: zinc-ribbon containing domain protein [Caudoviricetes sp.]